MDPEEVPPGAEQRIAQARVDVATEPVGAAGGLEPRAVDLRAHVLVCDAGAWVVPSAARRAGALGEGRANTTLGGGVKAVLVG